MPRFSANLGFLWAELPLLERIERAATAGFAAVELHWPYDTPAEAVRQTCQEHGVTLLALNTALGDTAAGDFGLGAVPGREADFQAAIDQSLAYCQTSGATAVHAMAGVVADVDQETARATFVDNLRLALDKAEQAGVTLLLEPINSRDKPGYFYSTLAEAAALIERIGSPRLKLMFDVYHVGVEEGDVLTKLAAYADIIGHVQIAAVPSRAEPDEGEIAYRAIFDALQAQGYDGWIGCEYKPRDTVEAGLVWHQHLLGTPLAG